MTRVTDYWKYKGENREIAEAQKLIKKFFELDPQRYLNDKEKEELEKVRREINLRLRKIIQILKDADQSTTIFYSSPPARGVQGNIEIFSNIFFYRQFELSGSNFIDVLERAEGFFDHWIDYWQIRRWNPYYWLKFVTVKWLSIPLAIADAMRQKTGPKYKEKMWVRATSMATSFSGFLLVHGYAILKTIRALEELSKR